MVKSFDSLPLIVKAILVFLLDPLIMGIYRICKGHVIGGIVWLITGGLLGIGWIIDFVQILLGKKVTIFA